MKMYARTLGTGLTLFQTLRKCNNFLNPLQTTETNFKTLSLFDLVLRHSILFFHEKAFSSRKFSSYFLALFDIHVYNIQRIRYILVFLLFYLQVDVFSSEKKGGAVMHLVHENMNSITSLNVFHPTKNILAGANSSGKVYLWT